MATFSGGRVWLLVIGVLGFLSATSLCSEDYKICNIPCCKVIPNCNEAYHAQCSCEKENLTLSRGDIPKYVETLKLSTRSSLTINREALFVLKFLAEVSLYDMDTLEVQEDGFKLDQGNRVIRLNVDHVRHVQLLGRALTGHWNDGTSIRMQAVHQMDIHGDAFSYQSAEDSSGPSLTLKDIDVLSLHPRALSAKLTELSLIDGRMPSCEADAIGPNISQVRVKNITMGMVKKGCINGTGSLSRLLIHSSNIGVIEPRGFQGSIAEVILHQNNFTEVQESGIHLQVKRFHLKHSKIRDLKSNSLSVVAKDQINFEDVDVILLRQNALSGLQVQQRDSAVKPMVIRNLRISQAENGSIALAEGAKLDLHNLHIYAPLMCPAKLWAQHLVGVAEGDSLTEQQQQVFHQLRSQIECEGLNRHPRPPVHYESTHPAPEAYQGPGVDDMKASINKRGDNTDEDDNAIHENMDSQPLRIPEVAKSSEPGSNFIVAYVIASIVVVVLLVTAGVLVFKVFTKNTQGTVGDVPERTRRSQEETLVDVHEPEDKNPRGQSTKWESKYKQPVPDTPIPPVRQRARKRSKSGSKDTKKTTKTTPSVKED